MSSWPQIGMVRTLSRRCRHQPRGTRSGTSSRISGRPLGQARLYATLHCSSCHVCSRPGSRRRGCTVWQLRSAPSRLCPPSRQHPRMTQTQVRSSAARRTPSTPRNPRVLRHATARTPEPVANREVSRPASAGPPPAPTTGAALAAPGDGPGRADPGTPPARALAADQHNVGPNAPVADESRPPMPGPASGQRLQLVRPEDVAGVEHAVPVVPSANPQSRAPTPVVAAPAAHGSLRGTAKW